MLELRPTCEHCNRPLPAHSPEAMICSFECTFCITCVEEILGNVCPNCGGGFCTRPVRPVHDWKNGDFLGNYPASTAIKYRPVDIKAFERFSSAIRLIPPERR